jgi:hypothetical protein
MSTSIGPAEPTDVQLVGSTKHTQPAKPFQHTTFEKFWALPAEIRADIWYFVFQWHIAYYERMNTRVHIHDEYWDPKFFLPGMAQQLGLRVYQEATPILIRPRHFWICNQSANHKFQEFLRSVENGYKSVRSLALPNFRFFHNDLG